MKQRAAFGLIVAGLALAGCADMSPRISLRDPAPQPVPIPLPAAQPANGAIFADGAGFALFEDAKAHNVGDLLTITLVESTAAQKKAETSTSKTSATNITDVQVLGKSIGMNTGAGGKRSFAGSGDSTQSNSLNGSLTVVVIGRLPNGLLQVRGDKQIELNQGSEIIQVDGVVRAIDIKADNTVTSDRIANARVSYKGRGALADANAQGWLSRFFNSPWFPF